MKQQPVDKNEIYDQFARLTQQTKDLVDSVEVLSDRMTKVLAENARLTIENEHLQSVIAQSHEKSRKMVCQNHAKSCKSFTRKGFMFAMICTVND